MNYNKLSQLLDNGLSPDEIIMTLMKTTPKLAKKIRNMLTGGLGTGEILNGLMQDPEARNVNFNNSRPVSASEMQSISHLKSYNSIPDSREKEALKNLQKFTRQAINIGSTVGGAYALSRAIPKALQSIPQAMQQILPGQQQIQQGLQGATSNVGQQAASITNNLPTPQQPPVEKTNIPQQQQPIQPEVKTIDVGSLLDKSGLKKHVDELSGRIKDPKQIAAILYNKYPEEMKRFQKESGKNMEDAIGDYLSSSPVQSGAIPEQSNEQETTTEQQPDKIEKKSIVASPNGIGTVKEIRNGQALIEVDGKLHKAKEEELIQSPLPEKDLADLYDDLIGGIEKESGQQVSRNVYWSGYDPNVNELAYIPHDGGLYVYDNISPEDAKELTNILSQRKSTGQNYIGTWEKGSSSPIGAKMYQLIQRLQKERGGKGNEYSNKFLKIYDALEPAKSAAKKKHEEQRKKKAKKPGTD